MNQYFGLLNKITKEFGIEKGMAEHEKSWKSRIIYSFLGQVAYASLFDFQEDLSPASIIHFKSRITDTLKSILEMYPELVGVFFWDDETLPNEIYNIYLNTGCIYHEPNRITACIRKTANGSQYYFLRGQAVDEKRYLSGLGSYLPIDYKENPCSIEEMFMLQTTPAEDVWNKLITNSSFVEAQTELNLKYLRTTPPFTSGYWVNEPELSGNVSIAQTLMQGNEIYYLYRITDSKMYVSQLPNWMTDKHNHRALAVGNLIARKVLPETCYHLDGDLVKIRIGYLFPPAEMNLIKLYSWPERYINLPNDFSRIMDRVIFNEFRFLFEILGYRFKEE